MPKQIHFLGWNRPIIDSVGGYVLENGKPSGQIIRLDEILTVVPTRESGRRLREKMAVFCRDKKASLLGVRIVTPSFFIQDGKNAAKTASQSLAQIILAQTLLGLRKDDCSALFPRGIPQNDNQWAFSTAKLIQNLRKELSDACLSIRSVFEKHANELQESDRWHDLAKIEKMYLENLQKTGFTDPCESVLADAEAPAPPSGIERIIMACAPDPSPLALKKVEAFSARIAVDVLVAAPAELQDHFDGWGRPLPEKWKKRLIVIPQPEHNMIIAANPERQAQRVFDLINAEGLRKADMCIGVPDRDAIPHLQDKLTGKKITAFDPADRPVRDHHLYHLIKSWNKLIAESSFAGLSEFLHNADILNYLHDLGLPSAALLSELDRFQNRVLPQSFADVMAALGTADDNLRIALKFADDIVAAAKKEPHEALRAFLERIFTKKNISGASEDDLDFKAVAGHIAELLNEIFHARQYLRWLDAGALNRLVLDRLGELDIPRHRDNATLELNGWLELAWNDSPLMIITGFNEGAVPDSRKGDLFLPDSLRKTLGLRNDESLLARDAFLLSTILASREKSGRVIFISGKTSPAGDPLKPSRLLFRCPDEQLAARTELLFREIDEETHKPPFSISFKLDPVAPLIPAASFLPSTLHATQFRDYLACPFRFYLKHILKMERIETKAELDARDFGSAIHAVLEKFSGNPEIFASTDESAIQKYLSALLDDYFAKNYGANLSFPILYARETAKIRLKAFARRQAESAAEGWEIVAGEISRRIPMAGMEITGKIDRIDRNRRDGRTRIIDYKTSDTAGNPAETHLKKSWKEIPDYARHGENEQWIDLQMPLYWLMHMSKISQTEEKGRSAPPSDKIELCYFNLPGAMANAGIEVWKDFDESLAESAGLCAQKIVERIKQGFFWPPAEIVKYDEFETLFNEDLRNYFEGEKIANFIKK